MKPNINWINDWQVGVNSSRETAIAKELLNFFQDLWDKMKLDEKSKTTRNRYANSMHALGGHIVEQAISLGDLGKTADDLLEEYIGPDDGPLIFQDNENWQDEVDMVCRKIYKHM
jgi:hypothetical protein